MNTNVVDQMQAHLAADCDFGIRGHVIQFQVERVVLNALAKKCGCAAKHLRIPKIVVILFGEPNPTGARL